MKTIVLLSCLWIAFPLASCGAVENSSLPSTSDILLDIQKVQSENDVNRRVQLADQMTDDLYTVWNHKAMDRIGNEVIDKLVLLLNDDEDWVRASAAAGIGYFGTRARNAAPALERALERLREENKKSVSVFQSGVNSGASIVPALKRIQGIPDAEIFDDPPEQDGKAIWKRQRE